MDDAIELMDAVSKVKLLSCVRFSILRNNVKTNVSSKIQRLTNGSLSYYDFITPASVQQYVQQAATYAQKPVVLRRIEMVTDHFYFT